MKKFQFTVTGMITCIYFFLLSGTCFAMDEDGCLTCHRYPGLVRLDKSDTFKVLHIDEKKYLKSSHGTISCKECHTRVVQVPHTGIKDVDCTTKCHRENRRKISALPLKNYHKEEQSFIENLRDETSCRVCHPLYPHSEDGAVRAILNMHTGFMVCEVCHIKRDGFNKLSYEWKDTENASFSGEPYGTFYNPEKGKAKKSEHLISRITVFTSLNGKKRQLINTWDTNKAKKFIKKEPKLKTMEMEKELEYFHKDIAKKNISVACNECHSSKSILDYKKLGFNEKKEKDLIYLNIKGLVTKYKVFYFPNLFGK